jgi:hypothetical protein
MFFIIHFAVKICCLWLGLGAMQNPILFRSSQQEIPREAEATISENREFYYRVNRLSPPRTLRVALTT